MFYKIPEKTVTMKGVVIHIQNTNFDVCSNPPSFLISAEDITNETLNFMIGDFNARYIMFL